jgi:hypothetical protein
VVVAQNPGDPRDGLVGASGVETEDAVTGPAVPSDRTSLFATVTAVDHSGRLGDRSPLRHLGWSPGAAVRVRVHDDLLISVVRAGASHVLTSQGHLRLPLGVRRRCRIEAGARLLVTAWSDVDLVMICTVSLVGTLLGARAAALSAGRGTVR